MPNLPISQLSQSTTLTGEELLVNVQGGVTKKQTVQSILNANLPVTSSGITLSGNIVPTTPQGATLGTVDKPFREIFLQSGSISIESDTPGDPSAIISNKDGNLEISVGGMLLIQPDASFIAPTGSFSYLSGSFNHIGSANRLGNTIITGSVDITGSFEADLQENYVWLGDSNNRSTAVELTSLLVTGPSGSQGIQGEVGPSGSQGIQGETPDTGSLVSKAYGSFFDTTTQTGSANTAYAIKHNTTDLSSDVSIVSDTRITMAEAGVYTIISTQQFVHTQGSTVTITGWLRKNGTDVPNSATDLRLKGNNAKDLYAINYFVSSSAGDYYEFIWSATDSDTEIQYTAARTSPTRPAVPSVITTVNRVG